MSYLGGDANKWRGGGCQAEENDQCKKNMADALEIDDTSPIRGAYFISINLQYKNCFK